MAAGHVPFRLDWRPSITWLQDIAGGLLMGFGAGMTPGGNDVLVLHDLPQLSGHAVPALLATIAGITLVMVVMRAATRTYLEVGCQGDVYVSRRIRAPRDAVEPGVATIHDSRSSTASERRSSVGRVPALAEPDDMGDHGSGARGTLELLIVKGAGTACSRLDHGKTIGQ